MADRKNEILTIAKWYFSQWAHLTEGETIEKVEARLRKYLNRDKIPFVLLAVEKSEILGVGQLKYCEMEDIFPEKEHWLGGLFVPEKHRGYGYGLAIAEQIAQVAPSYGVTTLFLQTERLDGGFYTRLGWRQIERVENRGLEVLVMERHLDG